MSTLKCRGTFDLIRKFKLVISMAFYGPEKLAVLVAISMYVLMGIV